MDTKFSNYDMFDQLISNNRKARSWTVFWVVALCILATVVIFLALANSKQKKTIADLSMSADYKTKVIDSLKGILQKEVDKKVDSISDYISTLDKSIQKIEQGSTEPGIANPAEQAIQKESFTKVSNTLRQLNNQVQQIKTDIRKDRLRVFIQYNEKEKTAQVNELAAYLKENKDYFIAPPEMLNSSFDNLIKVYNYENKKEELRLIEIIGKIFKLPPDRISVKHISSNANVTKPTIEIWIGTETAVQQMAPPKKN